MSSFYLVLVGPDDCPLSQHSFSTARPSSIASAPSSSATPASSYVNQISSSFPAWASTPPQAPNANGPGSGTSAGANVASLAGVKKAPGSNGGYEEGHLKQMAAHSSLDMIEDAMVGGSMYLKAVDRFNEWTISAFVAPYVKLILLHEGRNDDGIRNFFLDVFEAWTKVLLNPFQQPNEPVISPLFDGKVTAAARKHL